ncbi:gamma-glutamylcyclotransferase [Streptomyces thermospinosisporus]|uniref:Gamma-glutamylcyclotransferase n=1 Tax=Streptomyces thermospinosisporus TaxID=161482 RepID=A0ABN1Z2X3_9ACTN
MILPFFVYGTLRPGEVNHDRFLRGRTLAEEPGRLPGAVLYEGPGYPYAVEQPGGAVSGELVTARETEYPALLAELDRLEDYAPGDPRNLYERVVRRVVRERDGAEVRAWVYLAAPAVAARLRARGELVAGGDWRGRGRARRPSP